MSVKLMPLPYAYSALEPYIDTRTMHIHHDRHLKTYVDNLNNLIEGIPEFENMNAQCIILYAATLPQDIRRGILNNAGGVYNHNLYFNLMTPDSDRSKAPTLMGAIDKQFGSFENFKKIFTDAALSVFGSGYAWLVSDSNGMLSVITTANQDTPLPYNVCPVILIDVWEHAYYLKHQNLRKDYIEDWFKVADWQEADSLYTTGGCMNCQV